MDSNLRMKMKRLCWLFSGLFLLSGCVTTDPKQSDRFENMNRKVYAFNDKVDQNILRPIAKGYEKVTPEFGRNRIGDFVAHWTSPVTFANDVLQAEGTRAGDTLARFLVNTTVGLAGLWDAGAYFGIEKHREDFGQTLAKWGFPSGSYIVLPFLGPTTPRDFASRSVDSSLNPIAYLGDIEAKWGYSGLVGLNGLKARAEFDDILEDLRTTQADPYLAAKRYYLNNREKEIRNGREIEDDFDDLPEFDDFDDFDEDEDF